MSVVEQRVEALPVADLDGRAEIKADESGRPALLGSVCESCGDVAFPARWVCGRCSGTELSETLLSGTGLLYSYTVVHVSPGRQTPYTLGYVDLKEGARTLAPIAGDPESLAVGMPVEVACDEETWCFQPKTA
jgi:hypothetical protein